MERVDGKNSADDSVFESQKAGNVLGSSAKPSFPQRDPQRQAIIDHSQLLVDILEQG